jgi:hypothetical protein
MKGIPIRFTKNSDSFDVQLAGAAHNPQGDFPAIRNQYFIYCSHSNKEMKDQPATRSMRTVVPRHVITADSNKFILFCLNHAWIV